MALNLHALVIIWNVCVCVGESTEDKDSMGKANVQTEQEAESEKTQNS